MSEQTPSRGGAGTADGPDPQDRPDGDDREDDAPLTVPWLPRPRAEEEQDTLEAVSTAAHSVVMALPRAFSYAALEARMSSFCSSSIQ